MIEPLRNHFGIPRDADEIIDCFSWKTKDDWIHSWPSNGYIEPDGTFVEREYVAGAKTLPGTEDRAKVLATTQPFGPYGSKRVGKDVTLRPDHEWIKIQVMAYFVNKKFQEHDELAAALNDTGNLFLVEGNLWHDDIWGNCFCGRPECKRDGLNWLGIILMTIRTNL